MAYGTVTVYLNPPLHGAELHLMQRFDQYGNPTNIKVETTYSVNGVGFFSGEPYIPYVVFEVKFICQEVGGILYSEAFTPQFGFGTKQYEYTLNLVEEVPGTPTNLTIFAPEKVAAGELFSVTGILTEKETGIPIQNQPIELSYNGRILGAAMTRLDGDYLLEVSIPESGVWTLKADFYGTEAYAASRSLTDAVVAATPLLIVGPLVGGLALFIYGTS